ncbi:uncharacterized protein LOC113386218 [Ctenocephalides felis]|uniref:uncharacterized protein LOC113386164 n=1 Tax=Ctenocephalides felis TaxID=7515 RepID=UPI000E6E34AB|nr:uncharacterized protein LOC113386164 [Ctenocephalides felis]XP_026479759.1 uncharacterized protein LOC113386174 [Ctenocephalides felis]XP_026479780.1 uncharacterized protein LOC113386196 [Ctenocephalides felis]XP_026479799.1 uncharacterized protein LOC113386218 [Ctenocephalides felis]
MPPENLSERVVNNDWRPHIRSEGVWIKELPGPPGCLKPWYKGLPWHERLSNHHTLASIRQCAIFVPKRVPLDSLDNKMMSNYNHSLELFPDPVDIVLQQDTISNVAELAPPCVEYGDNYTNARGKPWRRLTNTRELKRERIIALGHPLQIAGLKERMSPHQVKLMNSGHHSPLTNPGYSRQPADGTVFRY